MNTLATVNMFTSPLWELQSIQCILAYLGTDSGLHPHNCLHPDSGF